ncbi:MAG TPA: Nif3-like dinuclear metal center hexameric protein, partial [Firmicutes bacterium]|nr:Nif3-like dinuclear metal center hexameric protein [Bacillota bacterium]
MPVRAGDIAGIVEKWAPLSLAAAWDNGGFQAGDPGQRV